MSILAIRALIAIAILGWFVRRGYERRRPVWTRASWQRFAALLGLVIAVGLLMLSMAIGVDKGIYDRMPSWADRTYFYILMVLAVASPLAFVSLLVWFANGKPDRQLASSRGA